MKMKKYGIVAATFVICLTDVLATRTSGVTKPTIQQSLVGLKGVAVTVSDFPENTRQAGLKKEQLQTDVELWLKDAGINVLSEGEAKATLGSPFLSVNVNTAKVKLADDTLFAVNIRILLTQTVFLIRDPDVMVFAGTWGKGTVAVYDRGRLAMGIRATTRKLLNHFIKDYLATNPNAQETVEDKKILNGTVRYIELEGGFYGLVADDGQKYNPVNLPKEYQKDGLRVKFQVKGKKGAVGIHMWGKIVNIIKIERLL